MDVHLNEEAEDDALREMAKGEFKLDDKGQRVLEYIKNNLSIKDFAESLSEEMWLREVLKDVQSENPFVRSSAIRMWGQYANYLKKNQKGEARKVEVEFGE